MARRSAAVAPKSDAVSIQTHLTDEMKEAFEKRVKNREKKGLPTYTHNDKAGDVELREVQISDLKIDQSYQRNPNTAHISEMAANWNDELCSPIVVAERGKRLFIMDGQQRTLAALLRGKKTINATVIKSDGYVFESGLFVGINEKRKAIRTPVKHRNALLNKDHNTHERAVILQKICDKNKIKIAEHTAAGVLSGTGRMYSIINQYGEEVLDRAFRLYRKAWPKAKIHAFCVSGLSAWISIFQDDKKFTDDAIVKSLKIAFPNQNDAVATAKNLSNLYRKPNDRAYAEIFTDKFNADRRGKARLSMTKVEEALS